MPDGKRILLTGATGFLGSHLCEALLGRGHRVVALARAGTGQSARERVLAVLERVQPESDRAGGISPALEVIEGDVAQPGLGLEDRLYDRLAGSLDEVWHCAASLSFLEEDREAIYRINVGGTRNVLDLASRIPDRRLHYISTAYVAGRRTGLVRADELESGQQFKNPYEESKFEAERLVRDAQERGALRASVFRPSIVIGDSRSGYATHFHGVYAFIRGLWTLRRRQTGSAPLDLRIRGADSSTLNFVPVDYVTEAIVSIAAQESSEGSRFHISNPKPTSNRLWKGIVCGQLGLQGVELVGKDSFRDRPMNRLETVFHRQMAFYHPYLESEPLFDSSATGSALEGSSILCPEVTPEFARRMTGWYIDRLNARISGTPRPLEQTRL